MQALTLGRAGASACSKNAATSALFFLLLVLSTSLAVAQPAPPPNPDVLVTTTFDAPLTSTAILERLDSYYDEEVGRKRAIAFPEIAPHRHFEVWHEMWAQFEPSGDHTRVTLKKLSDATTTRIAKSSMLDFAGRLNVDSVLSFKEEPGLRSLQGEVYSSRKDLATLLASQPGLRSLPSWLHSALFVSADPLMKISLSFSGLHGARQLTVTTVDLASARALMAKLQQGSGVAGICGVFSEEIELAAELHEAAQNRSDSITSTAGVPSLYHPQMDLKYIEERLRSDPAMQKRLSAAKGEFDVRFRVDKSYRKVTLLWSQLTGYSAATGAFASAANLGETSIPGVHRVPGAPLTARIHLETLKPAVFRLRLTGEGMGGEAASIDERVFVFDGKTFEEPQNLGQ